MGIVFDPTKYPHGRWKTLARAGAQERWFVAADGVRLNAWYWRTPHCRFATLFLHGNAGNVTDRIEQMQAIQNAGSSVLLIDYRGYGKSKGKPSERGLYNDAEAACDELVKLRYRPEQIVIHGESLGTAVATHLAARRPCVGLVLEAPLASLAQAASDRLSFIGRLAPGFKTVDEIRNVHVPVFIMHGDCDEILSIEHGRAVYRAAHKPKRLWRIRGANHNDLLDVAGEEYAQRVAAFYDSLGQPVAKAIAAGAC